LLELAADLKSANYQHGNYESFIVHDPKRREIAVAGVRDRVVHRLLYDYLVTVWDKSFCYDAWSCRKGKGLLGAIDRAQKYMQSYQNGWVWRSDIRKFFDTVDHQTLRFLLTTKSQTQSAIRLLDKVIGSYNYNGSVSQSVIKGMPIGNLTSQILANIYLNEFDQFVLHSLKPLGYTRYGDDFVLWLPDEAAARAAQIIGTQFFADHLHLAVNPKHDRVQPARQKLAYIGVDLWANGRRLQPRTLKRIHRRLELDNLASYQSLVRQHLPKRYLKRFSHHVVDMLDQVW